MLKDTRSRHYAMSTRCPPLGLTGAGPPPEGNVERQPDFDALIFLCIGAV